MTQPKFTPGPWHVEGGSVWAEAKDGSNLRIAQPWAVLDYVSVGERNANAALIAAAPDMYADALDTEHAYSWLMQELRDLQHEGATWAPERIGLFADSLIAYCEAHQIGTRAALAKAGRA